MIIVDTSVAIKWFVDDEKNKDRAELILTKIESDPRSFAVPELFFNEMLAVLCKLSKSQTVVITYMSLLSQLGMQRIGNGRELMQDAAILACSLNLSGYDAIFAATAKLLGGKWITADEKAYKKVASKGLAELL